MKRAKLKYSIAQNRKGLHNMMYNVLTSKYNWWCREYFKLNKHKQLLEELETKESKQ